MGTLLDDYATNDEVEVTLPERIYGKTEDVQTLIETALRRCRPLSVKELSKLAGRQRGSLVRQLHMMLAEKRVVLVIESHREGHERLLVAHPDRFDQSGEDPEKVFAEERQREEARAKVIADLEAQHAAMAEQIRALKAGEVPTPEVRPSMRVTGFDSVPPPAPVSEAPTQVRRRQSRVSKTSTRARQ